VEEFPIHIFFVRVGLASTDGKFAWAKMCVGRRNNINYSVMIERGSVLLKLRLFITTEHRFRRRVRRSVRPLGAICPATAAAAPLPLMNSWLPMSSVTPDTSRGESPRIIMACTRFLGRICRSIYLKLIPRYQGYLRNKTYLILAYLEQGLIQPGLNRTYPDFLRLL